MVRTQLSPLFRDRTDAGQQLGAKLMQYAGKPNVVVLALPRGGVPVGFEIARALRAPLDVFVVRKLGVPGYGELAMGAVAPNGTRVLNEDVIEQLGIPGRIVSIVADIEAEELARREREYRDGRPAIAVRDRTVILTDDGVATGATMRAAIAAVRAQGPARIVLAAAVAAPSAIESLRTEVDEVVCLETPEPFLAVGPWYEDFSQVTDDEVREVLARASEPPSTSVSIPAGDVTLEGDLAIPEGARAIVLFAHGSGSSRHSPRNRAVARYLRTHANVGTLLVDLLSKDEEAVDTRFGHLRFDIPLLADRLIAVTEWTVRNEATQELAIGYFGASTGAAAALVAAATLKDEVGAVVSRGGRPDLAGAALTRVRAPVLFIVGGEDCAVLEMNRSARALLRPPSELEIIPNATHLFEEPGALTAVAHHAARWFKRFLVDKRAKAPLRVPAKRGSAA